ncbi:MAG: radical SAM protein [Candidatus Omnitrophica bacterium]|nr:radical SAM protein [Candidatus Omnitrophota bacterium]
MRLPNTPHFRTLPVKRVVIFVGFSCMNDCRFCVAADKRAFPDKSTLEIKGELLDAYKGGARQVSFTGGECTARKDIFDLVAFARAQGFTSVQIQTNGRAFASIAFCKKMLRSGMTVLNPALHGHTATLHDDLTRSPGAFRQTVLGIHHMQKLTGGKLLISMNTVIVQQNYRHLPEIITFLLKFKVMHVQFAFVHAMGNARKFGKEIVPRKTDVMPYLKRALDIGRKRGVLVMAEAIPLCLMQGYEDCVSEFYIPTIEVRERGFIIPRFEDVRVNEAKVKFPSCRVCCSNGVCEGVWREYPEYYGSTEFKPLKSTKGFS